MLTEDRPGAGQTLRYRWDDLPMPPKGKTCEDLTDTETRLEREMLDQGVSKFLRSIQVATEKGEATRLGGLRSVLKEMVEPLSLKIEDTVANGVGTGSAQKARGILAQLEPRVIAYLAIKTILETVANRKSSPLTSVAQQVARSLEFESRLRVFAEERPLDYAWLTREYSRSTTTDVHRKRVMSAVMHKYNITSSGWADEDRVRVGARLITWFAELSNVITVRLSVRGRHDRLLVVEFRPDALKDIESINQLMAFNHPFAMPTVIPPRDWTTPTDGGYHNPDLRKRFPLVKMKDRPRAMMRAYLEEMRDNPERIAPVYSAVNAMQRTRWATWFQGQCCHN